MPDGTKSSKDKEIYTRIDRFVLDVLSIVKILPRDLVNTIILKQLIRSSTSIGANAREGQTAQTRREFSRCFSISKREANETKYWLWILLNQNSNYKSRLVVLLQECDELILIISSIILSTNKKKD